MKRLLLVLSFVIVVTSLYSKPNYMFRTLSPEGGFYHEGVNAVCQDGDGFIWGVCQFYFKQQIFLNYFLASCVFIQKKFKPFLSKKDVLNHNN